MGLFIKNAKTDYKIVVPFNALPVEEYAASELKKYVEQVSWSCLDVIEKDNTEAKLGDPIVAIGNTRYMAEAGISVTNLNRDGFKIKTVGRTILICGETGRGTLYGVYDFFWKSL